MVLSLFLILGGISYAWFNYNIFGSFASNLNVDSVIFRYKEGTNNISLNDAMPMTDEQGKAQTNYFEFYIEAKTPKKIEIPYFITVRKSENSLNIDEAIRLYLTKVDDQGTEEEVELLNFDELLIYENEVIDLSRYTEKLLHSDGVSANVDYSQKYRLRVWIDYQTDFTQSKYNNATFNFTVNVYSHGREIGIETVRNYIAKAEKYYNTVKDDETVALGTNVIDRLNLGNSSTKDQVILTEDGKIEAAFLMGGQCYKKSALSDDVDVYEKSICNTDASKFASNNGQLHVCGPKICNENNQEIRLIGSNTGIGEYLWNGVIEEPTEITAEDLKTLRGWGGNTLRLFVNAKGGTDANYIKLRDQYYEVVKKIADTIIANDLYLIINWDPANDSNAPLATDAIEFFTRFANDYKNDPHVIYEIWNEPTKSWSTIKEYANVLIPKIREISPDAMIIVGTPEYDKKLDDVVNDPLTYTNIMYAHHMYSVSYTKSYQSQLLNAINANLPIIDTEVGTVGSYDIEPSDIFAEAQANSYFELLDRYGISYMFFTWAATGDVGGDIFGIVKKGEWVSKLPDSVLKPNGKFYKHWLTGVYKPTVFLMNENMQSDENGCGDTYRSCEWKDKIVSIKFKNKLEVPNNAVVQWDLSYANDRTVIGYLTESTETGLYDMVICANGFINAPMNSRSLFANMLNLKSIDFTNFKTDFVTSIIKIFEGDKSLTALDLSGFNTTKIVTMWAAFAECQSLKSLNLEGWQLQPLYMNNLFLNCYSLKNVDISGFDVSNVTDFTGIFSGVRSITNIDISTWQPKKVESMKWMFFGCSALKTVNMSLFTVDESTNLVDTFTKVSSATFNVKNKKTADLLKNSTSSDITFAYNTDIVKGTTGDLAWQYNPVTTTLDITGSGAMADYSLDNLAPWYQYRDSVENLYIGENVTKIGKYAFYEFKSVTNIKIDAVQLNSLGSDNYAFYHIGANNGATLTFGEKVTAIPTYFMKPYNNESSSSNITNVIFEGNNIKRIFDYGLLNYRGDMLVLPEGLTRIYALSLGYTAAKIIILPDSLSDIFDWAVGTNYTMEKVVFGSAVNKVESHMFYHDRNLNTIVLPHINDPSIADGSTFFFNQSEPIYIYGDSSTQTWVNSVKNASGQTNIYYQDINNYKSSITSNTGISASVGYNGTYTFTSSGNVKVYYTFTTKDGKTINSNPLSVTKDGNTYTINNIKQDIYIEVK